MPRFLPAALVALATLTSGCLHGGARELDVSPVPGLDVSVDESFYGVGGTTAWELNLDLARRGPRLDGVLWQGLTGYRMAYSYRLAPAAEGCRVARPRVSVEVTTTLPRWKDREAAPELLRSDWDLYLSRLREHERGHQRIAILAGRELLEDVAALRASDCDALHRTALAVAAAYQASVTREQAGWDDADGHGLQGGG